MDWKYLFTSFEGRIGRQQFWIGMVGVALSGIVLSLILSTIFGGSFMSGGGISGASAEDMMRMNSATGWSGLIVLGLLAYPFLAVSLKRRHDRGSAGRTVKLYLGLSALMMLLQAVGIGFGVQNFGGVAMVMPNALLGIVGVVVGLFGLYLLVVMGFLRGDDGSNSYGPDPIA